MVFLFEKLLDAPTTTNNWPPTSMACAETGCAGDDPISLLTGEMG